ncbi:udp-n-acetylmuramoylalanyl-d-glutamate--2,6- diaminopimelate ligase [hydrocarbon metagenome]|uniref:Udp-n-acetylmuramoylalanyl-d-glutamate--2,6-diaminopimelate ligase n=1 Tax=hydrocarbon metagenome TaxID=938273 RepID=A0A0W8E580_9ZZZZ
MKLTELFKGVDNDIISGDPDIEISGVQYDSRKVTPGSLFVCITGFKTDGHSFAAEAVTKGAAAVLVEKTVVVPAGAVVIHTSNTRKALAALARNYYEQAEHGLRIIGVTGTNGKTTTTHLIKAILEEAGKKTAILGTLYAKIGDIEMDLGRTTPEALEIEEFISLCGREKAEYLVMEVSSHALDLHRVDKIPFNAAVYTNLTQDHLDYHQNMDHYLQTKLKLFQMVDGQDSYSIINADDQYADYFTAAALGRCLNYGVNRAVDVQAGELSFNLKGSSFKFHYQGKAVSINMHLIGRFSVYNALAAITCGLAEGVEPKVIKKAIEKVQGVSGRFEQVPSKHDFTVIVDYAHTPDGLENILNTSRQIVENRLITVFGCGGDRDRTKRPLMGEIAARYSDFCIVTSDNPRSEEPESIIADIVPGLDQVENSRYAIIVDRREAIRHAINFGKKGDLIIIAGKGHETYQLVKDQVLDFDDRKVAAEFLKG